MIRTAVIFSALALQLAQVQGQTFCTGGVLPCVENAVCDAATDTCKCAPGFEGNGRVACRSATTRCTCTALADPHFGLFDPQSSNATDPTQQQAMTVNMPCSVNLVGQFFLGGATPCLISTILAHPETRGTGTAANLRVFIKELEVRLTLPAVNLILDASGTTVTTGASEVVSAVNADNFNTATMANCGGLAVGFNGTYGGAFVDAPAGVYTPPEMCGNCDNTDDEGIGATNTTHLGYFLRFLAPTADQRGTYASQCGQIEGIVSSLCSAAELDLVADVCGRYLTEFGVCLVDDASVITVPDYATLLSSKFLNCVTGICGTGSASAQCSALTGDETATCKVGTIPASCSP